MAESKGAVLDEPWLKWATELQFLAEAGLGHCTDPFDRERFAGIRAVAGSMMAHKTRISLEQVKSVFCSETGFATPKIESRGAVFRDGKIPMVQERDGTWTLPGGGVDVNQSAGSNTVKEVKEESGLDVVAVKLIALHDAYTRNPRTYPYPVCKVFVLCDVIGGEFEENIETVRSGFFALDQLPEPLAADKATPDQIEMCFRAYNDENWIPPFD